MSRSSILNASGLKLGAVAAAALLLAACQTAQVQPKAAAASATSSLASAPVLRQDAFDGIYEVTAANDGEIFVASSSSFDPKNVGTVQRLDARTLQILQTVQVPRRAFALGLNKTTNTLYVGNTMEGSLSVVDASSGIVKGVIQLAEAKKNDKGEESFAHTRKVIVDEKNNRVFVTSPGQPGLIWIVDGATNTLQHTITSEGIWTAGAAYDDVANILYVSQGGVNEVLAIDPDAGKVVRTFSTGDSTGNTAETSKHFFINQAIDTKGKRLFITDANTNQLYVLDIASGKFIQKVPLEGLGVLDVAYNAVRNEVVVSNRGVSRSSPDGTGAVTVLDGASFAIKKRIDLPVHPNSLAFSPDGQSLYVSVKAPHGDKHPAWRKGAKDSLVRIDLASL